MLARGEIVESLSGVIGVEVLNEDRNQQPRLAKAALGQLPEQFARGAPLTIQVEVELTDPGPAPQDRVHLGVGGRPTQTGLADQELPARSFQRLPLSTSASVTLHAALSPPPAASACTGTRSVPPRPSSSHYRRTRDRPALRSATRLHSQPAVVLACHAAL